MFIGVIQWNSRHDPTVLVGPDADIVRREAVQLLTCVDPESTARHSAWDIHDDRRGAEDPRFPDEYPLDKVDIDDPFDVRGWLAGLRETFFEPSFTLYGPDNHSCDTSSLTYYGRQYRCCPVSNDDGDRRRGRTRPDSGQARRSLTARVGWLHRALRR